MTLVRWSWQNYNVKFAKSVVNQDLLFIDFTLFANTKSRLGKRNRVWSCLFSVSSKSCLHGNVCLVYPLNVYLKPLTFNFYLHSKWRTAISCCRICPRHEMTECLTFDADLLWYAYFKSYNGTLFIVDATFPTGIFLWNLFRLFETFFHLMVQIKCVLNGLRPPLQSLHSNIVHYFHGGDKERIM